MHIAQVHSFSLLHSIPLGKESSVYLPPLLLTNLMVCFYFSWLLQAMLQCILLAHAPVYMWEYRKVLFKRNPWTIKSVSMLPVVTLSKREKKSTVVTYASNPSYLVGGDSTVVWGQAGSKNRSPHLKNKAKRAGGVAHVIKHLSREWGPWVQTPVLQQQQQQNNSNLSCLEAWAGKDLSPKEKKSQQKSWVWWCTPVIPTTTGGLRTRLPGENVRAYLKNKSKKVAWLKQ
jgi:hypothetical protein